MDTNVNVKILGRMSWVFRQRGNGVTLGGGMSGQGAACSSVKRTLTSTPEGGKDNVLEKRGA